MAAFAGAIRDRRKESGPIWSGSVINSSFSSAPAISSTSKASKGSSRSGSRAILDLGKPADLIEYSRQKEFRDALPRVIRPDLILTEEGWTIAEIDSVPGGIGLTAWLNQTYAGLGLDVIGGRDGMLDGFADGPAARRRHRYLARNRLPIGRRWNGSLGN